MTSGDRLYTRQFLQVFCAVVLFMSGVALQFHFGQYLDFLGHDITTLGYVLSISVVGTLAIRLHIGRWIDRVGCRTVWLVGTVIVAAAIGSMQFTQQLWLIVALRTIWAMGMASVMTTVAVFAAQVAPPHRRAESIGTIGMAGFLGMIIGSSAGDWIFQRGTATAAPYHVFFTVGALCSLTAGLVMLLHGMPKSARPLTQVGGRPSKIEPRLAADAPVPQLGVIARHWPGPVLWVGVVFMMVFCFPSVFLERMAEEEGFEKIKVFFLVYSPTAIVLRIVFRTLPQRIGRRRTLLLGMVGQAIGLACLIGTSSQAGLVLPAILMGAGHCFVFPSMIDLAAGSLPAEHRGLGTSLILGAGDLGMLAGYAAIGKLIDVFGFDITLLILAAAELLCAAQFAIRARPARNRV